MDRYWMTTMREVAELLYEFVDEHPEVMLPDIQTVISLKKIA